MADSNRGQVKLPNFKERSPTPAIPLNSSIFYNNPRNQKLSQADFTHQTSPQPETKKLKMHHTEKTMLHSIREGALGQDGQLLATSQLH